MRHILVAAALLVAGITGWALAQTGTILLTSPAGTEEIAVTPVTPFPAGMNQSIIISQVRDAVGYSKLTPLTGTTVTVGNNVSTVQLTPAGGLSAFTLNTPVKPVDGQTLRIFTTQNITTFNLTASGTQTVNGNLAGALNANNNVMYLYSASNTTWDRIQ